MIRDASKWLAASDEVFFVAADSQGQLAGFVFSHLLGPGLWRSFLAKHLRLAPHAACAMMRRRIPYLRRRTRSKFSQVIPISAADKVASLELLKQDQPFAWSPPNSHTLYVDLLSVAQPFRGRNLATSILDVMLDEVSRCGVRRAEAHISHSNYASVRAFQKAEWKVVETSTEDLLASYNLEARSGE